MPHTKKVLALALFGALAAGAAEAQTWTQSLQLQRLWRQHPEHRHPIISLRDPNGNLTLVNGQFQSASNYSSQTGTQLATATGGGVGTSGAGAQYGQASAIGNSAERGRGRKPQHDRRRRERRSTTEIRRRLSISTVTEVLGKKGSPSHDTPRTQTSPQATGPYCWPLMALEGCISPSPDSVGRYTAPIGGAPVIANETPYSAALRCMSGIVAQHPVRIAVGQIADYTGKTESDGSGRKITAGRRPDGDDRAVQVRRPHGRAFRHLGRRNGTEIRQQQADRRRPEPAGRRLSARSSPARSPAPTITSSAASPS